MTPFHESIDLSLTSAESSSYQSLSICEMKRPDWVLSFVQRGTVETVTQRIVSVARAGDVIVHPPGLPFSENTSGPGTHLWIAFDLTSGPNLDILRLNPVPPVVTLTNPDEYIASFSRLLATWTSSDGPVRDMRILGRVLDLVGHVVESWETHGRPKRPIEFETAPDRFLDVITYMQNHIDTKLTRDDLAGRACLHPGYFDRAFRASFGQSPMQMLRTLRLRRARTLLKTTDFTLDVIADACGLVDGAHLSRVFRAETGMAPGRYRESAKRTRQRYMPP